MTEIILPWPPAKTSPNGGNKGDWRGKHGAAQSYKRTCAMACIAQKVRPIEADAVAVVVTYHPPRNGRLDWDNMAARCKHGFDAVAEAIGVDDGKWWPVVSRRGDKVQGGRVRVEIRGGDNG